MSFTFAIPSKGRLKEQALAMFDQAGLVLETPSDARSYQGKLGNISGVEGAIDVAFLSASEIARELSAGNLHAGITGEDLAREGTADPDSGLSFEVGLGFGHANVVIAVPQAWVDVDTMSDLDDVAAEFRSRHGRRLRIATKYWNLTQRFFADHGIAVYRIVESLGATEAAPSAGQADAIVDITSTGSTLKANGLKILSDGIILRSQANLIVSRVAEFSEQDRQISNQLCLAMATLAGRLKIAGEK